MTCDRHYNDTAIIEMQQIAAVMLIQRLAQVVAGSPYGKRLSIMELLTDAMIEAGMKPGDVIELLNCAADGIV